MELRDLYPYVKLIHVLLAIIAVGFNASYAIWIARAAADRGRPEALPHVLRTIKFLDDRFANPAYALLLVTGLANVFIGQIPLTTFWVAAALVLYVVAVALGLGLYSPILRRQLAVLDAEGPESAAFGDASGRARLYGIATSVPVLIIVFLMVVKPTL